MKSEARAALLEALSRDEANLAEAALLIAKERYPDLAVSKYLAFLHDVGERAKAHAGEPDENVEALNDVLFHQEGFRGAADDYYSPENSFLNLVIERRRGIPITLSIAYMEAGRAAGMRIEGVGLPGHFLVRYEHQLGSTLIDPFNEGRTLTEDDCRNMVREMYGGELAWRPDFLRAWTKKEILVRVMNNLKGVYMREGKYDDVGWAVDVISALNPSDHSQARDKAYALFTMGRYWEAKELFEEYLRLEPAAEDAQEIRHIVQNVRRLLATLA